MEAYNPNLNVQLCLPCYIADAIASPKGIKTKPSIALHIIM